MTQIQWITANTEEYRLHDNGKAIIQVITIRDDLFSQYSSNVDFIQKMIFPGGILPSQQVFDKLAVDNGFKIKEKFCFGQDYAKTLRDWQQNFTQNKKQILEQNYSEQTIKLWELYFAYCYNGFIHQKTDVIQYVMVKC